MVPDHLTRLAWLWLLLPVMAFAHKPSDSYLTLDLRGPAPSLRWDIALRDLEHAIGIDQNADQLLSWGEVQRRHPVIADYAGSRLAIFAGDSRCRLTPASQRLVDHSDGAYTVLPMGIDCKGAKPTAMHYRLLFDVDPTHRGQLRILSANAEYLRQLSTEQPFLEIDSGTQSTVSQLFLDQLRHGIRHIPQGLDHILFLLTLMLPAVMCRRDGEWRPVRSARRVGWNILSVVTAFTVAHSITLSLAVLGLLTLPGSWIEPAIAFTVLLAAGNNVRPFLPGRVWVVAFCLGLLHGFGFASALTDLGLSATSLAVALTGFNIGVEVGQILIVLLILPILYSLRDTPLYRVAGLQTGSALIAVVAFVWLIERSLQLELIPI
jgi:hypothetical protein